ncbi:MAG: RNA polymerase sigma factor [Lachnospiraceae bacterium]|nr:RNA polymerase sigma factor [Lachnospiraceae bacterium]
MVRSAEETVTAYERLLYRTALNLTGCVQDAEDLVQETFLRWLTKRPAFESDEHEKAWLLRVIINLSRNLMNSAAYRKRSDLLEDYPAADPEEKHLMEEIMRLPEDHRIVIHLYYYIGYSTKEIAAIVGASEGTVRSRLTRARRKLKDLLEEEE